MFIPKTEKLKNLAVKHDKVIEQLQTLLIGSGGDFEGVGGKIII